MNAGQPGPRLGPALIVAVLGFFVVTLDAFVVNVALPAIGRNLGGGITGQQWVVDGYTLMFAALLLSAGALADPVGARQAYGVGLAIFVAASAICGLAPNIGVLVGARFVQGAGAAVMLPATLALIREAYADPVQRGRAIALWSLGAGVASAAGLMVGGFLTLVSWRLIFFINLPVGVFALFLLAWIQRSPRRAVPFDWLGQLAAILGMGALDLTDLQLRWFDRWLKEVNNGVDNEPPVTLFVMGVDCWHAEADWPLPDTRCRPYYLHSGGQANTLHGDGTLSVEPPSDEPPDVYLYNPLRPVPTVGGQVLLPGANASGPRDQRPVESRDDVLVYSTPVLERSVEVTGPIELRLFVASSARDADFTGKLVDLFPDGRAMILTEGILRARYRSSSMVPELLEPDAVYELRLDLWATANVSLPGHRIRLEVSSSNFPRFARNSNTGGEIASEGAEQYRPAINRVFHDAAHPSRLILPIIER